MLYSVEREAKKRLLYREETGIQGQATIPLEPVGKRPVLPNDWEYFCPFNLRTRLFDLPPIPLPIMDPMPFEGPWELVPNCVPTLTVVAVVNAVIEPFPTTEVVADDEETSEETQSSCVPLETETAECALQSHDDGKSVPHPSSSK